ncbi:s1 RNA binding domain-containing protein [Sarocladium implicatum]|nr:s1 RNA binding domain-containing protein [Sarocladium implicatum]
MSTLKRKDAPGGQPPAKSAKNNKEANPSKNDGASKPAKTSKQADSAAARPKAAAVVSVLKEEEPMFPRGGGSVLTPLEQKQINMEAKADARHEEEFETTGKAAAKKKRKASQKPSKKSHSTKEEADDSVKIESLNFKVHHSRINGTNIEVALPNNLTGHVSIAAMSEQLTKRLQTALDEIENENDEDSADEADIDLASIFTLGQYLRVYVLSTTDDTGSGKAKRKIELSLRPSETNTGLETDDVVENGTVMASVVSVEDHGCVMDIGLKGLGAFLPKSEIDSSVSEDRLQPGAVFLAKVTGKRGKIAQLTLNQKKLSDSKQAPAATTINTFLPGTVVDLLVSHTDRKGLAGKVLGHLDATADRIHSGIGPLDVDLETTYKIGSRVKARVICNFPTAKDPKLGLSLLPHITALGPKLTEGRYGKSPLQARPISSTVEKCKVTHVESDMGLFVDLGNAGIKGFVHISRVKDGKVDALYASSGPFQTGSTHKGRIISYNPVDGIFQLSFQQSVLDQQYIRLEDVPVGAIVDGEIEKVIVGEDGVSGITVKIADGITGYVTERHLSDVRLQHPEKKFREGLKVKARVLSVNVSKKRMRLTMKKTLVNSEAPVIKSYNDVSIGMQVPGTITNVQQSGARIHFYGSLQGYLPTSEMSEAYISDPKEHFRAGQVVSVHILDVDADRKRLVVSCKDPAAFGLEKQTALKALKIGDLVSAKVTQKTEDQVLVELEGSGLKATLPVGHLTDKSMNKTMHALKRINVGQTISNLMVLDKDNDKRAIVLTQKPSLLSDSKDGKLLSTFEDCAPGQVTHGFVKNITQTAVFVQFGGNLRALLPKSRLSAEEQSQTDFGMHVWQTLEVKVISTIPDLRRVLVAPANAVEDDVAKANNAKSAAPAPQDGLETGSVTKARITAIKRTQLNVQILKSEVQGRVDVSQVFDSWSDIADAADPLAKFSKDQKIDVRVIGVHEARDHRFLPFSHRTSHSVLELTAKPSDLKKDSSKVLTMQDIKVGDSHMVFVNNTSPQHLWVTLSPSVRGRISAMDVSDDSTLLSDIESNFPVGTALKATVTSVDPNNNRLDLSCRSSGASEKIDWKSLKKNMVLPGRITKVNERQAMVKLSDKVAGPVHLPDMVDNFDDVNSLNYLKGDVVRVAIVDVDVSNKRLRLSMRPSRIMSSTLPVKDKEISSISDVAAGDVVRGFVKNVADNGLFVLLGGQITARVKISNLSDKYLKEWKDHFQVDQLVKGRVITADTATNTIELSLKESALDDGYVPPVTYESLRKGQVVTGKIRKVEDFGAFIVLDDSSNVSGLCHRSQMAERPITDATTLYKEGDKVKALVLEVDPKKRRISLGLKPSFFQDEDTDMDSDDAGAALDSDEDSDDDVQMGEGGASVKFIGLDGDDSEEDDDDDDDDDDEDDEEDESDDEVVATTGTTGLGAGKKSAWTDDPFADAEASDDESAPAKGTKKGKKKATAEPDIDRTAQLDINGPQTSSDYERLLLGQPDSSELWIAYMAFQMQVSDLTEARKVAKRAIKAINIREEAEKLNVWIAYLNLEVAYGSKHTVEEVFKEACQYNDEQEVYERLASIYIQSEKLKVCRNPATRCLGRRSLTVLQEADKLFEAMLKKFGAKSPSVWTNYAHFLHVTKAEPVQARALLPRATQQLPNSLGQTIISRFAALEFRSPNGEPEVGRTMFEGLLAAYPKKGDLWSQLLDLEMSIVGDDKDATAVRDVFERRTKVKGLKPQQAEKWFRRWAEFEQKRDGKKGNDKIMAKAQEWTTRFKAKKEADAAAAAAAAAEEMEE